MGHVKLYPNKKVAEGGGGVLAMLKGGTVRFGVSLTQSFGHIKGGAGQTLPIRGGGGGVAKCFRPECN